MEGYGTMKIHDSFDMPVKPSPEAQAAEIRAAFPECSAAVDFMRDLFGDDVQVLAMSEGDKEIKPKNYRAVDDHAMWMSGTRFLELGVQCRRAEEYAKGRDKNAK
jgi:hypothetical protein